MRQPADASAGALSSPLTRRDAGDAPTLRKMQSLCWPRVLTFGLMKNSSPPRTAGASGSGSEGCIDPFKGPVRKKGFGGRGHPSVHRSYPAVLEAQTGCDGRLGIAASFVGANLGTGANAKCARESGLT